MVGEVKKKILSFFKSLMTSQQLSINELMDSDWHSLLKVLSADSEVDTDAREDVVDLADFIATI